MLFVDFWRMLLVIVELNDFWMLDVILGKRMYFKFTESGRKSDMLFCSEGLISKEQDFSFHQ